MQTIDKSVALSQGLLPCCCIFMSCLGKIFNQSRGSGWLVTPAPPSSPPASHNPTVNNMHHSLDLAHICAVQLAVEGACVCVCVHVRACMYQHEGLLQGVLDKWRCHMVRPDVLVSYVHSSSKTTTSATIGSLRSSKASQPICFLPARPMHYGYWRGPAFSQFPTHFVLE